MSANVTHAVLRWTNARLTWRVRVARARWPWCAGNCTIALSGYVNQAVAAEPVDATSPSRRGGSTLLGAPVSVPIPRWNVERSAWICHGRSTYLLVLPMCPTSALTLVVQAFNRNDFP